MKLPNFELERGLWEKGFEIVGGADEVGKGSFAGPVVTAVVAFPSGMDTREKVYINDSKKLTQKQRKVAVLWIKRNAKLWSVGEASVGEINRMGIGKATNIAYRRAIKKGSNFVLFDAISVPYLSGLGKKGQIAVPHGDSRSTSIAAASIVAKVYRDSIMQNYSKDLKFSPYKWESNMGYGTKAHREAILKYGITKHHRTQFVATFMRKNNLS